MFKMAKYYVLVNLYRKAKRNIVVILVSLMIMVLLSYLFSDLVAMEMDTGYLFVLKWAMYLILLSVIVWNVRKMTSLDILVFGKQNQETVIDAKKEKILKKEHLLSKSEIILNKYRGAK